MNYVTSALKNKWQNGILHRVYNLKDEHGRGRFCIMFSGLLSSIAGQLSGGLFLTSFLLMYGLDKSRIGILTFLPYMASLLNIFSPVLLERFKKRRWLLISMRLFYYGLNILGVTILPSLARNSNALLIGFILLVFLANVVNQLASSGWTAWNAEFLPEEVRVDYFQTTTCIQNAFTWVVALGVSFIGDLVSGTEHELMLLTIVRYAAFGVAILDCMVWLFPKEYPYLSKARVKISNVFTLPVKNRRFVLVVFLVVIYHIAALMPNATLNAYLLEDVGISYSLINGINALYFLFFFFLSKMWKKFIMRHYWFRAFGFTMLMEAAAFLMYAFVTENTVWLYVVVRLTQHVIGVLSSSVVGSLIYVVLPEEDQTNYLSFYTVLVNGSAFLSMMFGTWLAAFMGSNTVSLLGFAFTSTQLCLLFSVVIDVIGAVMAIKLSDAFTPPGYFNTGRK